MQWSLIERICHELRNQHRIKSGVDFAVTHKCQETRIICAAVYASTILEAFSKHGVKITSVFAYPGQARIRSHPGEILRMEFLAPDNISNKALADHIGVPVQVIDTLCLEATPITAELAFLLSMAFGTTPDYWMTLQSNHDLSKVQLQRTIVPLWALR